jgi:hypothetical protein
MARLIVSAVVVACLGLLVGCDEVDEADSAAEEVAAIQVDDEPPKEPEEEEVETDWTVKLSGAQTATFEGDRYEVEKTDGEKMATLQLRPKRPKDKRFNKHTHFAASFSTEGLDKAGEVSIEPENAEFNYASRHGGEYICKTRETTELTLEKYSDSRIAGSYKATMGCQSRAGELLGDADVEVEFDIPR